MDVLLSMSRLPLKRSEVLNSSWQQAVLLSSRRKQCHNLCRRDRTIWQISTCLPESFREFASEYTGLSAAFRLEMKGQIKSCVESSLHWQDAQVVDAM